MFNWFKNLATTAKVASESDVAAMQGGDSITPLEISESETLKNQGNVHFDNGKLEEAAECYRSAIARNPLYAEAYTNLGRVFQVQGNLDEAVALYRKAIEFKPSLLPAHQNLGIALINLGQADTAEESLRRLIALAPENSGALQSPEVIAAHNNLGTLLMNVKRLPEAEASYRRALELKPDYAEAHYNLGTLLMETKCLTEAEAAYRRALELKPDYADAHGNLGNLLKRTKRLHEAEASYRRALALKPDDAEAHYNFGNLLVEAKRLSEAEASYRRALELKPDYAEAHNGLGNLFNLNDLGQLDSAVASYRKAVDIKPDFVDAHSNLGIALMEQGKMVEAEKFLNKAMELSPGEATPLATALMFIPYQPDDPRFNQLEAVYARRESLPLAERVKLNFSMGKAMENIGQYDRSFSAYEEGNRLHYQGHSFDEAGHEFFLKESCNIFTADLFNKCAALADTLPATQDERVPIFIVGMPRSGTTLIEQILASHPAVYGAGELAILADMAKKIKLLPLDSTSGADALLALRKLGQEYLDRVWKFAPDARYITDKMPGNYLHLGLIHLMLPNAKIIHSMRDPMDACFSCYALQFTYSHEYSYDLGTLGRQYLRYRKLMEHWHNVLPPGRIIDVSYEDNVADHEREARRLLEYLGLPWDPICLKFHENRRAVHTASITQVRKPIYSSSVGRWKHFEKHLDPLLEIIHPTKLRESVVSK